MAPEFKMANLFGESVTLTQHLGKEVVLLDFWASWCPPCRKGLPMVDSVAKHFAGQPVAVYGVNVQESAAQVSSFMQTAKLDLPILMDGSGIVAEDYGVTGIPQSVVIGKDGRVHAIHVGVGRDFEESLRSEIETLLASD